MAISNASDLSVKFENITPMDHASDGLEPEDIKAEDIKSEVLTPDNLEPDQEEEGSPVSTTVTPPIRQPSSIALTAPHWQSTRDSLLRFPGMVSQMRLFPPGSPMLDVAFALGVTDLTHAITEHPWVPIAERVFEIQTCCMMQAKHLDLDVAPNGWVTWDISAEWCARVLQDLQGKGFHTTCTALVPFVLRAYLRSKSWIRHRHPRGRQMHKQIMDEPRPDPCVKVLTLCSTMAKNFSCVVRQYRTRKMEMMREHDTQNGLLSDIDDGF